MTTTPQRSQEQTANITDQLCHQLCHQHAASAQTTEQAIHWISTHRNLSASFNNDIQALNLFRVETTSAILEIQRALSRIDMPSWINKRRIDKLEEQNEDYRAQISDLQAELALTKTIATRALKRARCHERFWYSFSFSFPLLLSHKRCLWALLLLFKR